MDVLERLPDAELGVMQALWAQKAYPASSGELMEALAGKRWRMPTLLTTPRWCAGRTIWPQRAGNFSKSSTAAPCPAWWPR